jgi:hypothetical protein
MGNSRKIQMWSHNSFCWLFYKTDINFFLSISCFDHIATRILFAHEYMANNFFYNKNRVHVHWMIQETSQLGWHPSDPSHVYGIEETFQLGWHPLNLSHVICGTHTLNIYNLGWLCHPRIQSSYCLVKNLDGGRKKECSANILILSIICFWYLSLMMNLAKL